MLNYSLSVFQVPFLSLGEDTVGDRVERCRGNSEFSGEFVVEDVQVSDDVFRRLIFLDNKNITQSEAKLKFGKCGGINNGCLHSHTMR